MNRYFTAEADRLIGEKVLEYNRHERNGVKRSDEELAELETFIRERTGILLYLIPQRNLYIKEEDLSGFYLDVIRDIDRIIGSFSISGTSYIAYLTQICRYRCMRYMRKKERKEQTEMALIASDPSSYSSSFTGESPAPYSASNVADASMMDLAGIIRHITKARTKTTKGTDPESVLANILTQPIERRRFLEYLLNLPQVEDASFMAGVSRVLRVDGSIISRFYELRRSKLADKEESIENAENIAARYWKAIARLRQAIAKETDESRMKDLMKASERASRIYNRRLELLRYAKRGLSQHQIASLMGMPRSTVSNDISRMRELLRDVSHSGLR